MCKNNQKTSKAFVVSNLAKKRVSGFLAGVLLVGGLLTPKYKTEAHEAYLLSILPNIDNLSYQSLIVDDSPKAEKNHIEFKFMGGTYHLDPKSGVLKTIPLTKKGFELDKFTKINGETSCMFTFPTCSTTGGFWEGLTDSVAGFFNNGNATNEDRQAAERVGRDLTNGANTALAYISNTLLDNSGKKLTYGTLSQDEKEVAFLEITARLGNAIREKSASFTYNGNKYTLEFLTEDQKNEFGLNSAGTKGSSYARIKHQSDSSKGVTFLYSTPRYSEAVSYDAGLKGSTEFVDLFQIIAFGNASYALGNVTVTKVEAIFTPSFVEQIVIDILNNVLQGLRNFMGLNTMGELMFNEGSYGANSYKGIAPISWFQAADVLFWVSQVFAWLLLAFASLKFLGMHMWSTVTPMNRVSLMNGIQNILITAFILSMIVPIFNTIAQFNFLIVGVLRDTSVFNDSIINGQMFPGTLAGIILAFFFFLSELVINFIYILRGATICLLYGLSPVFVVAFAFGGRFQSITLKFVKELIGNIFIQTFHAVILTFYGLFLLTGSSGNFFVSLVLVFAFIPMTKVFKEITGIGESGFIQGVADQAKGVVQDRSVKTFKGGTGALASGEEQAYSKHQKSDSKSEKSSIPTATNDTFKTSSYREEEKQRLNAPENARSMNDAVGADTQISKTASTSSEGTASSIPSSVTLDQGGGSANEFGKAKFSSKLPTDSLSGKTARAAGYMAKGAALTASGAALGALGGLTGSKLLQNYGKRTATAGYDNGYKLLNGAAKHAKAGVTNLWEGVTSQQNLPVRCDQDREGNYCSLKNTYSTKEIESMTGITDTYVDTVDDRQCLIQEFSADSKAVDQLSQVQFDPTTGRVTDESLLSQGLTHVSKMDNGSYRVAIDMQKAQIKDYRSLAGGTRCQIKTGMDHARHDMNFATAAIERAQDAKNSSTNPSVSNPSTQVS